MVKTMVPGKLKKNEDFNVAISRWEARVNTLARDYNEKISEMMKIGILISMVPDDLQEMLLQQADNLKDYRAAKYKVTNLVDARAKLKDPNAMDVGAVDDVDGEWDQGEYEGQGVDSVVTLWPLAFIVRGDIVFLNRRAQQMVQRQTVVTVLVFVLLVCFGFA